VMAIEHTDFDGTERLALVLGADIVSTFDTPEHSNPPKSVPSENDRPWKRAAKPPLQEKTHDQNVQRKTR